VTDTAPPAREVAEATRRVVISRSLDNLQSADVRFLQEAARLGSVRLDLWSDALVQATTGRPPFFPEEERLFLAQALRDVDSAALVERPPRATLPDLAGRSATLAVPEAEDDPDLRARCLALGIDYRVEVASHRYSVPFGLIGERVEVFVDERMVEICHKGEGGAACAQPRPRRLHHRSRAHALDSSSTRRVDA